jgi:enolase
MRSVEAAGYRPGDDVVLALDCAATEYFRDGAYHMEGEGRTLSPAENADYLAALAADYPIRSIEDGMAEDDLVGWKALTDRLGATHQLVGDDLFVTNPERLAMGIEQGLANSILIKVNQIGTLTETLEAVSIAHRAGLRRSCRTARARPRIRRSPTLAVATNCGQIRDRQPRPLRSSRQSTISCSNRRGGRRRALCRTRYLQPPRKKRMIVSASVRTIPADFRRHPRK